MADNKESPWVDVWKAINKIAQRQQKMAVVDDQCYVAEGKFDATCGTAISDLEYLANGQKKYTALARVWRALLHLADRTETQGLQLKAALAAIEDLKSERSRQAISDIVAAEVSRSIPPISITAVTLPWHVPAQFVERQTITVDQMPSLGHCGEQRWAETLPGGVA